MGEDNIYCSDIYGKQLTICQNSCTITIVLMFFFSYLKCILILTCLQRLTNFWSSIEYFHKPSRQPYWCSKTMKQRPCWCPKPIPWELKYFHIQTLSFVPINLHRRWPRETTCSNLTHYEMALACTFCFYNGWCDSRLQVIGTKFERSFSRG